MKFRFLFAIKIDIERIGNFGIVDFLEGELKGRQETENIYNIQVKIDTNHNSAHKFQFYQRLAFRIGNFEEESYAKIKKRNTPEEFPRKN